jgi:two-component system chemotaxis sensor kinase CheA
MIGELVINHSQFEEQADLITDKNEKLINSMRRVSGLTKDVQNLALSLRMVSLKSLFQRIYRIGMDTVFRLGKNVEISISGEDTEIDRSVVEMLVDPLIHLMNNSIYHGIEDEKWRIKNEKSAVGHVKIEAYSKKGKVYIAVSDDGRGIEPQKVLRNAINKNLVDPFIDYGDEEIMDFVFIPGLSTLDEADGISGRGVGLDVVQTQISKMGGKIEIKNVPDEGCTFILKLPINLAIIKGTIVDIGGSEFIIPTLSISNIFRPDNKQWVTVKGITNMIKFREEVIPVINIEKILGLKDFDRQKSAIIVLESGQKLKALPVSAIIENRDIIVKTLGVDFDNLGYAFGASILGSGKISIILDIENIFKKGGD